MSLSVRALIVVVLTFVAASSTGCTPAEVTQRHVFGVTGGGVGESWLVVEETSGRTDRQYMDSDRYVVYRCVPTGCAAVSVLRGSERRELPPGSASPTTIPTPK